MAALGDAAPGLTAGEQRPADAAAPAGALEADAERAHTHQLRNGIASLVLLVALVVALLLAVPGLAGVSRALRHVDPEVVLLAVGLEFVSCVGYVLVFQLVFARAPRRFAARLAWTEMAFGSALSFGGAGSLAVGAWVLRSRGMPADRILLRSAVLFMLTSAINIIVLVSFGLLLGLGLVPGPRDPLLTLLPAAVGVLVFAGFWLIPRWARSRGVPRDRVQRLLFGFADSIRVTRGTLLTPDWRLVGGLAYLLCDIAVLYVCLAAIGPAPPLAAVVVAYQIGYLANIIPVPGGIGVLDSGLVGMLVLFDVPATPATAAVLIYHAIALWVPTVFGSVSFLLIRRTLGKPLTPLPLRERARAGARR